MEIPEVKAQVNARMLRHPDVSQTQICFVYAGDIWVVPKEGGTAVKLSSPKGEESFPRFSPDGSQIAFSGNYNGNTDVFVVSSTGGLAKRVTYHGSTDRMVDWHPEGERILFASTRRSGRQRFSQFYLISPAGGMAERLPIAYAEFGSFSPDGKQIAFTDRSRVFRTWKRYRGGWAADILLFNLEDYSSSKITSKASNDELPMWHGNKVYFLSDQGPAQRYNIWVHDLHTQQTSQLTRFKDFDVHFPSIGPEELVFEAGGNLYLMNLASQEYKEVKINVVTDQQFLVPRTESVEKYVQNMNISPDGKRALVEARGEIFSLPAEEGYVKNLTHSSGTAERFPAWSPDGKFIAYWSDASGEYELTIMDVQKNESVSKVTSLGPGFRYHLFWSPDSKKLAFVDQTSRIKIFDREKNRIQEVDQGLWMMYGGQYDFSASWSADSRWLAYARGLDNQHNGIFLYDVQNQSRHQVTSGFYNANNPVFDPEGNYLYVTTDNHLNPIYGNFDYSFVYPNSTHLAAICLRKEVLSPLAPKNDEVRVEKEEENDKEEKKEVTIDLEGLEERMVILPPQPGNYSRLRAAKGKLTYLHFPNTGASEEKSALKYFDLEKRKEQTVIQGVDAYELSADGKKVLVFKQEDNSGIVSLEAGQKLEKPLPLQEMKMVVDPKAEWKQIFTEGWRLERDYFYDKNMHGVDWSAMRERYGKLLEDAVTRWDVNFVLGELIGELNASHTYRGGGDTEQASKQNVGYLGIDWDISGEHYRIGKIIKGAAWDAEVRSPLAMPGVDVKEGDYILAVNGVPLSIEFEPYHAFQGLGEKVVELLVNEKPELATARKVIVKTLNSETRLRHLAWIEAKRQKVEEASGGKIGYIYVRSTGIDGQNELVRQFAGQRHKEGLVIDERFNNGGQIPDRFIELLNRKPLAYWAVRDGKDWVWPPTANFGPKAMLINGWSGSGGDAFPDYFRKAGLGPLIGSRTWGGLIGISGAPSLIDGGSVTVPTFRMYNPDGTWFKEGHGVEPDIEVPEDPTQLALGNDLQLEKAIDYIMEKLNGNEYKSPKHSSYEAR
ncbi:PDZ domain-containing protein [Rapidithrix thailandica]|uniref:Tricorn protease homolog n=1 Tax=Rapidithrix thailandica TaxID=413964 RepID=A0AAW9RWA5_9BACT